MARAQRKTPFAVKIVDVTGESDEWIVFARFAQMPVGSMDHLENCMVQVNLIEVL